MRILILNQAFPPDVVSTAQHAGDLAQALVNAGHEVTVIASQRGYDDPRQQFAVRESWHGVRVVRVPSTALGKNRRWTRAADFATFMASCASRALLAQRSDVIVAMTSPPLISVLAALLVPFKARRFVFWCMDLNPDEAILAGWLREGSVSARGLSRLLRYSLRKADAIVALDRFMKERICAKDIREEKVHVIAPWSHDDYVGFDAAGREAFRRAHGLQGKFVVMYSGNHSPCHPLDTVIEAARRLQGRSEIVFCFVGGGSEFRKLETHVRETGAPNICLLPYQPLRTLAASLSAADLHVVIMGEPFVGVIHPCKIYNVLAVGAPLLYVGPPVSHVTDAAREMNPQTAAYSARCGDVDGVVKNILAARDSPVTARQASARKFSKQALLPRLIDIVENGLHGVNNAPKGEAQVVQSPAARSVGR